MTAQSSPFQPIDFNATRGKRATGVFVSIDRYKRLMLSSQVRQMMSLSDNFTSWIAVYYDKSAHRIAIQKEELVSNAPTSAKTKVDRRGYFNARSVIESAAIDVTNLPLRYYYDGDVTINGERFLSFKLRENKLREDKL